MFFSVSVPLAFSFPPFSLNLVPNTYLTYPSLCFIFFFPSSSICILTCFVSFYSLLFSNAKNNIFFKTFSGLTILFPFSMLISLTDFWNYKVFIHLYYLFIILFTVFYVRPKSSGTQAYLSTGTTATMFLQKCKRFFQVIYIVHVL